MFKGSLIPGIPGGIVGFSGGDDGGTWGSGSFGAWVVSDMEHSCWIGLAGGSCGLPSCKVNARILDPSHADNAEKPVAQYSSERPGSGAEGWCRALESNAGGRIRGPARQ
jgi:hypothetical protein